MQQHVLNKNKQVFLNVRGARTFVVSALNFLLEMARRDGGQAYLAAGGSPELLKQLNELSINDFAQLNSGTTSPISIIVDESILNHQLKGFSVRGEEQRLLALFIERGATNKFLMHTLGATAETCKRLRNRAMVEVKGRPARPNQTTVDAIHQAWDDICANEPSLRYRFEQLSNRFAALTMASLDAIVCAYEKDRKLNTQPIGVVR